jgi:hypothetical protein
VRSPGLKSGETDRKLNFASLNETTFRFAAEAASFHGDRLDFGQVIKAPMQAARDMVS